MINENNDGFTLIEMSVIILVAAVMIAMSIAFALSIIATSRQIETNHKLKLIKEAIAEYAVMNNRIPCPAQALRVGNANYGFENGTGTLGQPNFSCGSNNGMVPFRTLGISENLALDAWDNPITYAVSRAFTLSTVDAQRSVHVNCLTREWFYTNGRPMNIVATPAIIDAAPLNPEKAGFCCAGFDNTLAPLNSNLIVEDQTGNTVLAESRTTATPATNTDLFRADEIHRASIIDPTDYPPQNWNPNGIAYVLVSHGSNGLGAFNLETNARINPAASACEVENGDTDVTFRDCEQNDNVGAPEFNDDITVWATQDQIFASQNESCAVP